MKKNLFLLHCFLLLLLSACSGSNPPAPLTLTPETLPEKTTAPPTAAPQLEPTSDQLLPGSHATAQALAEAVGTYTPDEDPSTSFFRTRVSGEDQAWQGWIQEHAVSLSLMDPSGFQDLEPLKELLQDKRIVLLGEAGHNVAEIDQVKVRLVKFLHEELGYNVVAFESSMLNAHLGNQILSQQQPLEAICRSIRLHWQAEQVLPLFEYMAGNPELKLAGFDLLEDFNAGRQVSDLIAKVDPVYAETVAALEDELDPTKNPKILAGVLDFYKSESPHLAAAYADLADFIDTHLEALAQASPQNPDFPRLLRQSAWSASQYFSRLADKDLLTWNLVSAIRDEGMAENIRFLLEEAYPDQKIILWAHNGHIRRQGEFDNRSSPSFSNLLQEAYGDQMYALGTLINQGKVGNYNRQTFALPGDQALDTAVEPLFHDALGEGSLAFLDFSGVVLQDETRWLDLPVSSYEVGGDGPGYSQVVLAREYDGVIYIDRVTPSSDLSCPK